MATAAPKSTEQKVELASPKLIERFAERFGVDGNKLLATLKATAFRQKENAPEVSNEQMMALLVVADQYKLNPFTREIFAFPDKNNGIVPVVSVDGWTRIINEHPKLKSIEFHYSDTLIEPGDGCPLAGLRHRAHEWIEVIIEREDRTKPMVIREFLVETYRPPFTGEGKNGPYTITGPWQTHTNRFLRHKTLIQGARLAMGFAGIYDEDEANRIVNAQFQEVKPALEAQPRGAAGLKTSLLPDQPPKPTAPAAQPAAAQPAAAPAAEPATVADHVHPAAAADTATAAPTDVPFMPLPAAPITEWTAALDKCAVGQPRLDFIERARQMVGITPAVLSALESRLDELVFGQKK